MTAEVIALAAAREAREQARRQAAEAKQRREDRDIEALARHFVAEHFAPPPEETK